MAIIPKLNDPTLDAVRTAMEVEALKETPRDYIGASSIGDPCARKLYYRYHNYKCEPFNSATLMRFDDGHRTEDLIVSRLKMVEGVQVWEKDEDGEQFGFSDFDGKYKGHLDGIIKGLIQAPKTPHVLEVKCSEKLNDFRKLKKQYGEKRALKEWNFTYYVQGQIYMHEYKLDRHYTVVASPGGRDFDSCRTDYDKEVAIKYKDRAFELINAKQEPQRLSEKSDFWLCRFCEFKEECHV